MSNQYRNNRDLTEYQERFVAAYADQGFERPAEAARRAGYAPDSATQQAAKLLSMEKIQQAIEGEFDRIMYDRKPAFLLRVLNKLERLAFAESDCEIIRCEVTGKVVKVIPRDPWRYMQLLMNWYDTLKFNDLPDPVFVAPEEVKKTEERAPHNPEFQTKAETHTIFKQSEIIGKAKTHTVFEGSETSGEIVDVLEDEEVITIDGETYKVPNCVYGPAGEDETIGYHKLLRLCLDYGMPIWEFASELEKRGLGHLKVESWVREAYLKDTRHDWPAAAPKGWDDQLLEWQAEPDQSGLSCSAD